MNHCILIMGVSGSGKTSIGKKLAEQLELPFIEADDFHPISNKEKMNNGIPLNDMDREGWLNTLSNTVVAKEYSGFVLACSALKEKYRRVIQYRLKRPLKIFHLHGPKAVIAARMKQRQHYMPASLLDSQFDILEISPEIHTLDISLKPDELVHQIIKIIDGEKT